MLGLCYADASRPVATDVTSAVERLRGIFSDLEFYYGHEIIYGMGRYESEEELSAKEILYNRGKEMCDDFLNGSTSSSWGLVGSLDGINLEKHTDEIKEFIAKEFLKQERVERW